MYGAADSYVGLAFTVYGLQSHLIYLSAACYTDYIAAENLQLGKTRNDAW